MAPDPRTCTHLDSVQEVTPSSTGCEDCLKIGGRWVHLRLCMTCGHVGCCDNSPGRHATGHFQGTDHPIIRSYEPGEDWAYCYVDESFADPVPAMPGEAATRHFAPPHR